MVEPSFVLLAVATPFLAIVWPVFLLGKSPRLVVAVIATLGACLAAPVFSFGGLLLAGLAGEAGLVVIDPDRLFWVGAGLYGGAIVGATAGGWTSTLVFCRLARRR